MENNVAALTILRGNNLLLVQRSPHTNRTHPDVVSVPTLRIPSLLAAAVLTHDIAPTAHSAFANGHDPRIFVTEAIMSQKLGMSEALERGELQYETGVASVLSGTAEYAAGEVGVTAAKEPLRMINLKVTLSEPYIDFPVATPSYTQLFWVATADFLKYSMRHWWGPKLKGVCIASTKRALVTAGAL